MFLQITSHLIPIFLIHYSKMMLLLEIYRKVSRENCNFDKKLPILIPGKPPPLPKSAIPLQL